MKTTRRDFIRYVGLVLASWLTRSCDHGPTCYTSVPLTKPTAVPPAPGPGWATLRKCWLNLDNPGLQSFDETDFSRGLRRTHADALDALVESGELDAAVAEKIEVAFGEAISHVQRQMATCYVTIMDAFAPREDMMQQAALLEEMAGKSDLDPETVARAQAALERDVAWLAQFRAGEVPGELEDVEVTPASAEAARILVELLMGRQ